MIPKQGYPVTHINIAGFYRSLLPWDIAHNIKAAWWLMLSGHRADQILSDFKPDIAIGTGGYVSGPVIRKAEQMGIPVFLHEQNAYPGVTTKMLAPKAETIFLAFPEAEARIPDGKHFEVVGNPVRQSFMGITKKEARALGWDSSQGNLSEAAPCKSIGGDYFGNYEGRLPEADGREYHECDINSTGGYRGAERIVFSNDGLIYYTGDHYETFELLYGEE